MIRFRTLFVFTLAILVVTTPALGWAPGTHAYVVTHMKGVAAANQNNLIFGAIVPDINQMMSTQQDSVYFFGTHYGAMSVWKAQDGTPAQHELAFGYITHNELFGADHFSHIQSHIYPDFVNPYLFAFPEQNGYVWQKSTELCSLLKSQLGANPLAGALLDGPKGLMNCHFIVEYGMDILLKWTRDPQLGQKLIDAVNQHDSGQMVTLLMTAYPDIKYDFVTPRAELGGYNPYHAWAGTVQNYGSALNQPMGYAAGQDVDAVADFLVALAAQLLKDDLANAGVDASALKPLIYYGLVDSIAISQPDFAKEVNATIGEMNGKLASNKIKF